ncbi:MAG: hypothetical protein KDD47_18535 [Acidobacteria bacterium]|nr:hypothetical protein [Acidobacteriota bacterium]
MVPAHGRIRLISPEAGARMEAAFGDTPLAPVEEEIEAPAEGEHRLTVVAVDEAGNRSWPRRVRVVVDTEGPQLTLVLSPAPVPGEGSSPPLWLAPGSRAVAAVSDEGSEVQVLELEEASGLRSSALPRAELHLPRQGAVSLRARAVDGVGNETRQILLEGRVDGEGPVGEIAFEGPQVETDASIVVGPKCHLSARFTDSESGLEGWKLRLDGVEADSESWLAGTLTPGRHRLSAEAFDRVGNRTLLPEREIVVDKEGPEIRWRVTSAGAASEGGETFYSRPVSLELSSRDDAAGTERLEWSMDGSDWSPLPAGSASVPIDGESLELRAVDRVGNHRQATASWRVDDSPPRVILQGPFAPDLPPGSVVRVPQGSVIEAWAEDDGAGVADQQVSIRRGQRYPAPRRFELHQRGTYRLEVRAMDRLGNAVRDHWWVRVTRPSKEGRADGR